MGFKRKKLEADLKFANEQIARLEESKKKMYNIMVKSEERILELEATVAEYERDKIIELNGGTYDVLEEEEE